MINETLQEQAAIYVSGAMTAPEREQFELVLEFHEELRSFAGQLSEVGAAVSASRTRAGAAGPSAALKTRVLAAIADRPQQTTPEGMVMTGPDGLVQWVNSAFSKMCGYSLEELRGKKPGSILQGEKTDLGTADRMRSAVHECRPCHETILNYHKNGTPYWVEIAITPIFDDAGQPLWIVAREREIKDRIAA